MTPRAFEKIFNGRLTPRVLNLFATGRQPLVSLSEQYECSYSTSCVLQSLCACCARDFPPSKDRVNKQRRASLCMLTPLRRIDFRQSIESYAHPKATAPRGSVFRTISQRVTTHHYNTSRHITTTRHHNTSRRSQCSQSLMMRQLVLHDAFGSHGLLADCFMAFFFLLA